MKNEHHNCNSCDDGKNKKIKVIQVNGTMNIGGIETFIMNLYRNIDRDKFEFVFLMHADGPYDYQEEAEKLGGRFIKIVQSLHGSRLERLRQLNALFKKEKPDAVHCHTYFDSAYVMLVAKYNKVKVRITHSHTTEGVKAHKMIHSLMSKVIRNSSTTLVACGEEAGLALFNKPGFTIIKNGIDLNNFTYSEKERVRLRKELGIGSDEVVVGHVGRLAEVKNHAFLIEIAKIISVHNPKYKFVFVGGGPLEAELRAKVEAEELGDTVKILGARKDTDKIYNLFDIVVFPSLYEGIPMALVEAQANGLPIIASSTIDKAVKMNDNFSFVSLDLGAERWSEMIEATEKKRGKLNPAIKQYSIKETAKEMERLYRGEDNG